MSAEKKKELQVAALENGIAIDHIPPSQLFKVAKLLGLENMDNTITIGNNFHSNKMGSKGMIKISDKFFCDEEIIATDNGDATSLLPFQLSERDAYNGLALVILRSQYMKQGKVLLTVESKGLPKQKIALKVE